MTTATLNHQTVETLKGQDRFFHAGALSAALGCPTASYGCHFGMRSTRDAAADEFARGFAAATADMNANR